MIQHCRTGARAWERHREYLPDSRGGAAGHHDHTVGQEQSLIDIVGDHHHGFAVLVPESHELIIEFHASEGIEETERLIEQQDFGLEGKSPGNTDALTHTGGQLIGVTVSHLRQANEPEVVFGQASLGAAPLVAFDLLHGQENIVTRRAPRQERWRLTYYATICAWTTNFSPPKNHPTLGGFVQAHDDRQHR